MFTFWIIAIFFSKTLHCLQLEDFFNLLSLTQTCGLRQTWSKPTGLKSQRGHLKITLKFVIFQLVWALLFFFCNFGLRAVTTCWEVGAWWLSLAVWFPVISKWPRWLLFTAYVRLSSLLKPANEKQCFSNTNRKKTLRERVNNNIQLSAVNHQYSCKIQ